VQRKPMPPDHDASSRVHDRQDRSGGHRYRFRWTCSYMGNVEYEVAGDGPTYRVELRREAPDCERAIFGGTEEDWQWDVVGTIGVLKRVGREIPPAVVQEFNTWRAEEHARLIAEIGREGPIRDGDPVLQLPPPVRGGIYVVGAGWRVTD
jgi:hypothetical protein